MRHDPAVRAHLEAENAYAREELRESEPLQQQLYDEMVARIEEDDVSVPVRDGPFLYYVRNEKGKNYPIHCRRPVAAGDEQIYFDENVFAEGHAYFHCSELDVDVEHRILAYTIDTTGDERYELRVRDLHTGEELSDLITDTGGSAVWAMDGRTIFYTKLDASHRPYQVWRHALGEAVSEDVLVYEEGDERFFVGVHRTRDGAFIVLGIHSRITSEEWVIPAHRPDTPPRVIAPRRQGVEYMISHHRDRFFIRTNDGATNFKVVVAPLHASTHEAWEPFIEHDEAVTIRRVDAFVDHVVVTRRRGGVPELLVVDLATRAQHVIEMPEAAYGVRVGYNPEFHTSTFRFTYSSMVTPRTLFEYDMRTHTATLLKRDGVPGYDPSRFVTERVWATAPDGERVPVSLMRRAEDTGPRPLLLIGYGAYASADDPTFSAIRLPLVERGITVGIAHVRGGAELGRRWYEAGRLRSKKNTFTDFIACAEHLVTAGYAAPDRLAIYGDSAGGLLVGAVVNARPELFAAVVADVPFVDVLNTMLDPSLPLTVVEWEEWGNPSVAEDYEYIASYAPYENVRAQAYPPMLVLAGWNDPRVAYWEPAKFVARIRERRTNDAPLLLLTNLEAGHGGPSGRYPAIREWAMVYAFFLQQLDRDGEAV